MQLDLSLTVKSGQTPHFTWHETKSGFARVLDGKIVELGQENGKLKTNSRKRANELLRAKDDLGEIQKSIVSDGFMGKAVGHYRGLRLTKSDLWETMASFVLSSNRSIPIIRQNVRNIMQKYGDKEDELHSFPLPEQLAKCTPSDLRKMKCGFRDKYLLGTTHAVLERGDLEFKNSAELREFLLSCPGIGEKIADCTLLYGHGDVNAFPVDVWVQRAMEEQYFNSREQSRIALVHKASEKWGSLRGYAQLYLFYEYMSRKGKV